MPARLKCYFAKTARQPRFLADFPLQSAPGTLRLNSFSTKGGVLRGGKIGAVRPTRIAFFAVSARSEKKKPCRATANVEEGLTAMLATLQSGNRVTCLDAPRDGRVTRPMPGKHPALPGIIGTNGGIGRRTASVPCRRFRLQPEVALCNKMVAMIGAETCNDAPALRPCKGHRVDVDLRGGCALG